MGYNFRSKKNRISNPKIDSNSVSLRICIWNFNGLRSSKVQHIKDTNDNVFNNILSSNDLICFSETWRNPSEDFSLRWDDDFIEFHESGARIYRGGRSSGWHVVAKT